MPYKPKRPCARLGCAKLIPGGSAGGRRFCDEHARQDAREYERYRRDPETRKRYGAAWRRIRNGYITAHPLCEQCQQAERFTPAQEVHHIKSLAEGGTHDESNLMALCSSCHSGITLGENNRRRNQ